MTRALKIMAHDSKPQKAEKPDSEADKIVANIHDSEYCKYAKKLYPIVKNRKVISSKGGKTGYILFLDNDTWVTVYLENQSLLWVSGSGTIDGNSERLINSPSHPDGNQPLNLDIPYANEPCDIGREVQKCHDKTITGLAYGQNSFNICFEGDMELDAMTFQTQNGEHCLRVFWEQW